MNINRAMRVNILFAVITILFSVIYLILKVGPIDLANYPGYYAGDDAGGLFQVRMIMEYGYSFFTNDQLGYPFGIDWRMMPPADIVTVILIKILKFFTDDPATVLSSIFFLTFPFVSLSMYMILSKLNINVYIAFITGQLYTFIPFHFTGHAHYNLCYYYMFPMCIFYALKLATEKDYISKIFSSKKSIALHVFILLFIVQTSLYMIVISLLIIGVGVISYLIQYRLSKQALKIFFIPSIMFIGIGLNWSPTIYAKFIADIPSSISINHRSISDSETYGGRLSLLLLPATNHNSKILSDITNEYIKSVYDSPHVKSVRQHLGVISGVIFIFSLLWLLGFKNSLTWQRQVTFLGLLNVALFFWFTKGGGWSLICSICNTNYTGMG